MLIVIPSLVVILVVLIVAYFINFSKYEEIPEEKETIKTINLYKEGVGFNTKELGGKPEPRPALRKDSDIAGNQIKVSHKKETP